MPLLRLNRHHRRWSAVGTLLLAGALVGPVKAQPTSPNPPKVPAPNTGTAAAAAGPVRFFDIEIQGQRLRMAFREQAPPGKPAAPVVMLFHGKNFSGSYWDATAAALVRAGYRVVVPDQIGFGLSSKPDLHYSFHLLARATAALLDHLGINRVAVVGHSMGGMLAVRFALLYPARVGKLVLENPIGLEDYRAIVPYTPVEEQEREEAKVTHASILAYHKGYYTRWRPEFERLVAEQASAIATGEWPRTARANALTYEMIYLQPVVHELPLLKAPTLLIIGQDDRTVVGKNKLPAERRDSAGQYPVLGKRAQAAIPGSRLLEIPDCGHIPHVEMPDRFLKALIDWLGAR